MRATLADPALTRYAGRFVWLELDYDKPVNQPFLRHYAVSFTPTLLVVDAATQQALVSNAGGLSIAQLERFLEAGEGRFRGTDHGADSLLAQASVITASGQTDAAVAQASRALAMAGPSWPARAHAYRVLTWGLMKGNRTQACAETAAAAAPTLPRGEDFGAVVLVGLQSSGAGNADWARRASATLTPLAEEAVGIGSVIRDHRFQLYQALMSAADAKGDSVRMRHWGHRWLDDIEAIRPRDDDERSALDIARVDAAGELNEPNRVLPALIASERAMPGNYNASLRLAQMLEAAKRYEEALAACDRGIAHATGPLGKSWLLRTRADVLDDRRDPAGARAALVQAIEVAKGIGEPGLRASNVNRLTRTLEAYDRRPH
jgi:tetratricopeptide (TPR) repeat protein